MKTAIKVTIGLGTAVAVIGGLYAIPRIMPTIKYQSYGGALSPQGVMEYSWKGTIVKTPIDYTYKKGQQLTGNAGLFNMFSFDVVFDEATKKFTITIKRGDKVVKTQTF